MKKHLQTILFLCILFLSVHTAPAAAEEVIRLFDSAMEVQPDASVIVTERITVNAEGKEIRRGIQRILPLECRTPANRPALAKFELLSAQLDGAAVPAALGDDATPVCIRLGDPKKFVSPGLHTYEIRYRLTHTVRFFEDFDLVYWNVTGSSWSLPIDRAVFHLQLPDGGNDRIITAESYTGKTGSEQSSAVKTGPASFETASRQTRGEDFTVRITWPKGIVPRPVPPLYEQAADWIFTHTTQVLLLFSAMLLLLYFILWYIFGKDPKPRTVIPLFHAPHGYEPGRLACCTEGENYSSSAFAADIIHLAVMGHLKIRLDRDGVTLKRLGRHGSGLSPAMTKLYNALFRDSREIKFDGKHASALYDAKQELSRLYSDHADTLGKSNFLISLLSTLWILPFCILLHFMDTPALELLGSDFSFGYTVVFFGVLALFYAFSANIFFKCLFGREKFPRKAVRIFSALLLYALPLLCILECFDPDLFAVGSVAFDIAVSTLFIYLMPVRTQAGAALDTEIQGFKMYLQAAEAPRLAYAEAPEDSLEVFQKFLPYAFALGCAEAWAGRFADMLEAAQFRPEWCSGSIGSFSSGSDIVSAMDSMSTHTSDCLSSASSSGGSSSGGGSYSSGSSGGCSGGGSGGGGGGW